MGWVAVIHSPDRDRLSRHKLAAGDVEGLLAQIAKGRARVSTALGFEPAVVSCYEAGYDGFWLHRRLTAAGIENLVIDPASLADDRRARRADRQSGGEGKSVAVSVGHGGRRISKKKKP